ncbi:class I adenylate-forming enzyme family protein [Actinopolymorpha alba]|uniref:class I adenylate-forming enzyme family protein n=1 Tax=Actinopolymorpha alba TaxID=533267 RepID=UPI0003A4AB1C|nr:AMP-binding protein [Actinopolymorpha alba]
MNVADLVRRSAETAPDRLALIAGDRRLTWAELDRAVDTVAAALSGAGLVTGFRVAIALTNSVEFVTAYFGALRAGLVAVPINPASRAEEVAGFLAVTRARVVLTDGASVAAVRQAIRGHDGPLGHDGEAAPLVVPVGIAALAGERTYDEFLAAAASSPAVPPADPETLAALVFTSGSGGTPRTVMLTHRALLAGLDQMAAIEPPPMGTGDVVLGVLPFCHIYGLNGVVGLAARTAGTIVVVSRFDPEHTLDLVAAEKVTNIPAVPPILASWLRCDDLARRLASVRVLVSGAAPLPAGIRRGIQAATGLVVHEGYGLTEAAPVVTSTLCSADPSDPDQPKPGSVGAPLPGVQVRVVDETGADVEVGEPGEVLVRGPNLFSGYWPDATDAPGEDGWFATGDLGYLDEDGDLALVDRQGEVIVVSGFSVYPREVEELIAELEQVAEVAVVAVPDERTGAAVKAYVVPRPGQEVTAEAVLSLCRDRLARFKQPSVVQIVPELPRSVTGRVAKSRLRIAER